MLSADNQKEKKKIIIIDFGSQLTKLIARRVRELRIYCEILNLRQFNSIKNFNSVKGIILSGGPSTVTKKVYPKIPKNVFEKKIPILGICYGLQLIAKVLGGKIKKSKKKREFGEAILKERLKSILFKNFFTDKKAKVWMSHQDAVFKLPKNFKNIASTNNSKFTAIQNEKKRIYGIQFHPEATHTKKGFLIIKNFVLNICKIKRNWIIGVEKSRIIKELKNKIKNDKVICALSGGVDSSVVALLVNKAIKKNLRCIMVDTGLLRKNEFKKSYTLFKYKYGLNVRLINSQKLFYNKLKNISDPEKKKKNYWKSIY